MVLVIRTYFVVFPCAIQNIVLGVAFDGFDTIGFLDTGAKGGRQEGRHSGCGCQGAHAAEAAAGGGECGRLP